MIDVTLARRIALITGGSSGIGAATATVFAECGAAVAIGYWRNAAGATGVVSQLSSAGHTAIAIQADLRRHDAVRTLVTRAADALGPIDVLVNNAGSVLQRYPLRELTEAGWDEILALNLKSAAFCAQAVAGSMVARRAGAIVNVASIAGHTGGGPGAAAYAAAKGGLIALTKALARELAPHGVRVNAIAPGTIDTPH
jgi:3-oxoacyl-[acyl-carrier protein] reductase